MILIQKNPIRIKVVPSYAENPNGDNANNYSELDWVKFTDDTIIPACDNKYLKWHDAETFDYIEEMTDEEKSALDAQELAEAKAQQISDFKTATHAEIIAEYPIYKQININELQDFTQDDKDIMWKFINTKRDACNAFEEQINKCSSSDEIINLLDYL